MIELATMTDARWTEAGKLALSISATKRDHGWAAANERERVEWLPRFSDISTYGICARDYASFSEEQQRLVVSLLLAGRLHLALAGELADGRSVLLTHAGVTVRETTMLGEATPLRLAAALEVVMASAIDRCRSDWNRGRIVPLDLSPLHVAGAPGEEAGGLLVHRPAARQRAAADVRWEFAPERPRRFDPSQLPPGLIQVAGHTGHAKCLTELAPDWVTERARSRPHGGIRTLRSTDDAIVYDMGLLHAVPTSSDLILVDGEMRAVLPSNYDLLPIGGVYPL